MSEEPENKETGGKQEGETRKTRRLSEQLLQELQEAANGTGLRPIEPPAPERSTFVRGVLLHEIKKGKQLKEVGAMEKNRLSKGRNLTLQRGGFLHELRSRRPGSEATRNTETESVDGRASTCTAADGAASVAFASSRPSDDNAPVKASWLHKRAQNGIWQKRWFVLSKTSLSYFHKQQPSSSYAAPRATAADDTSSEYGIGVKERSTFLPLDQLHDPHPGNGAEFFVYAKDRQIKLRAANALEAGSWVSAILEVKLSLGQELTGAEATCTAEEQLAGLVCPTLCVAVHDASAGARRRAVGLTAALTEAAKLLGEDQSVIDAVGAGASEAEEAGGLQMALLRKFAEWKVPSSSRLHEMFRWSHPLVLQPALDSVYENLSGKLSYAVVKDTWEARFDFDEVDAKGTLTAVHHFIWFEGTVLRNNSGVAAVGDASAAISAAPTKFKFRVELELAVEGEISADEISACALHVIDYEFGPGADRVLRDESKAALKPLVLPHLEFMQVWRRPLHRLPVHKDVPRLLKGMLVTDAHGGAVYRDDGTARPANPEAQVAAIRTLILGLAQQLDSADTVRLVEEKFADYFKADTGDVAASLRSFLLESGMPEEALAVQVLKCIHQEMIFPAVTQLRTSIYTIKPYKDVKGEWRVLIEIRDDKIVISHKKWEQAHTDDPLQHFKFRWCAQLSFDRRMRAMTAASTTVLDFNFGGATTEEQKRVVMALLKPWLAPGVLYKRVIDGLAATATAPAPSFSL